MLQYTKQLLRSAVPPTLLSAYHLALAFLAALWYEFPSRHIIVVGVTGTKGKSSTIEFANSAFEASGRKTALMSTIRTKINERSLKNTLRMTMPGRFAVQLFLRQAVDAGCDIAFVEMTSEGARQHRHRFIDMDALVFTNIAPEHIESHGSFEAYADAKFEIGRALARSRKRPRIIVANADDKEAHRFLILPVEYAVPSSPSAFNAHADETGCTFIMDGTEIRIHLPGEFSLQNALLAALLARALGIRIDAIKRGFDALQSIPGRAEKIDEGQPFLVVVDYAHTPDSLTALYKTYPSRRKICVLGSSGGGRDTWKRPVMGSIAEAACEHVILTNEDPHDEDPRKIVESVAAGMKREYEIIIDRRTAIARAFQIARSGDAVLITGKGTDPTIQGPHGTSTPWSDADVAREELHKLAFR